MVYPEWADPAEPPYSFPNVSTLMTSFYGRCAFSGETFFVAAGNKAMYKMTYFWSYGKSKLAISIILSSVKQSTVRG